MAPLDEAGREIQVVGAEEAAVPAATALAVVTTASALTSYGYTQAQADALIASHNALRTDVAALRAYLGTISTAANES